MAKGSGDKASPDVPQIVGAPISIWHVIGMGVIVCIVYKSGYETGVSVSRKILRRHDKDVKRLKKEAAKREKQLRKELSPETEKKWKWWPW